MLRPVEVVDGSMRRELVIARLDEEADIMGHGTLALLVLARDVRCAADIGRGAQKSLSCPKALRKRHHMPLACEARDLDKLVIENCILSWKTNR